MFENVWMCLQMVLSLLRNVDCAATCGCKLFLSTLLKIDKYITHPPHPPAGSVSPLPMRSVSASQQTNLYHWRRSRSYISNCQGHASRLLFSVFDQTPHPLGVLAGGQEHLYRLLLNGR